MPTRNIATPRRTPEIRNPGAPPPPPPPRTPPRIRIASQYRPQPVPARLLRVVTSQFLHRLQCGGDITLHFISPRRMAALHLRFLGLDGSTDILTFDLGSRPGHLAGELFISPADAAGFALEYRTSWREEVLRYVLHGLLHLVGHSDLEPDARRRMKRLENRLLKEWLRAHPDLRLHQEWPDPATLTPPRRRAD